jgi:hypothetical protein
MVTLLDGPVRPRAGSGSLGTAPIRSSLEIKAHFATLKALLLARETLVAACETLAVARETLVAARETLAVARETLVRA